MTKKEETLKELEEVIKFIKSDDLSEIRLTIQEGKFHQVKRMFQAVGKEVVYLKRLSMGSLTLPDDLAPGDYRPLTIQEKLSWRITLNIASSMQSSMGTQKRFRS